MRRQQELELLKRLPRATFDPSRPKGVLLSDEIEHYVAKFKLIEPYDEDRLKAASYELRVGELCSVEGRTRMLGNDVPSNEMVIEPFQVAVIQTLERINLPQFLIARWNIRVHWAYQGLMWVGGPQVDPGYQGYLFCPIYNLSDKRVILRRGDAIAQIDFATTTPPGSQKLYPDPSKRSRLLFEDYNVSIRSALAELAEEKIERFGKRLDGLQIRNEVAITIIVAALAVIVGAVTVVSQKPETSSWNLGTTFNVLALVLALGSFFYRAVDLARSRDDKRPTKTSQFEQLGSAPIFILIISIVLSASVSYGVATAYVNRADKISVENAHPGQAVRLKTQDGSIPRR